MEIKRIADSFLDPENKSLILASARITGAISGTGDLVLEGELQGDVSVSGLLVVGEKGTVHGKVNAANLIVAGVVRGRIAVQERIEIRSSASIEGNIACSKIAIAEGASLDGEVHTHKGKPLSPDYFTEKRRELQNGGSAARPDAKTPR